jgi:PDZ domain
MRPKILGIAAGRIGMAVVVAAALTAPGSASAVSPEKSPAKRSPNGTAPAPGQPPTGRSDPPVSLMPGGKLPPTGAPPRLPSPDRTPPGLLPGGKLPPTPGRAGAPSRPGPAVMPPTGQLPPTPRRPGGSFPGGWPPAAELPRPGTAGPPGGTLLVPPPAPPPPTVTRNEGLTCGNALGGGALVRIVQENSPAADSGLEPGDIITAVNGISVRTCRDLEQLLSLGINQGFTEVELTVTDSRSGAEVPVLLSLF